MARLTITKSIPVYRGATLMGVERSLLALFRRAGSSNPSITYNRRSFREGQIVDKFSGKAPFPNGTELTFECEGDDRLTHLQICFDAWLRPGSRVEATRDQLRSIFHGAGADRIIIDETRSSSGYHLATAGSAYLDTSGMPLSFMLETSSTPVAIPSSLFLDLAPSAFNQPIYTLGQREPVDFVPGRSDYSISVNRTEVWPHLFNDRTEE